MPITVLKTADKTVQVDKETSDMINDESELLACRSFGPDKHIFVTEKQIVVTDGKDSERYEISLE